MDYGIRERRGDRMKVWVAELFDGFESNCIAFVTNSREKAVKKLNNMGFFEDEDSTFRNPKEGQTWLNGERVSERDWIRWENDDDRFMALEMYVYEFYCVTETEMYQRI